VCSESVPGQDLRVFWLGLGTRVVVLPSDYIGHSKEEEVI
jgi:hypothetical protein